jgi:hypothetical protein
VRILGDESLPRQLVPLLVGHDARMVQAEGWSSVQNGELLRRAAAVGYDVFVTPDRKLEYQQHIPRVGVAVVVVRAHTNRIEDIRPLVPALLQVLPSVRAGTVTHVGV